MFNPSRKEKIIKKIRDFSHSLLSGFHRSLLKDKSFTIISNNCWGGICYEYFGLVKNSPTVGCFFFADDYLRFVKDLKMYMSKGIEFISIDESLHRDWLLEKKITCPIGKIGDVEIIFQHYKNSSIAKEKWERRVKRINWNNLIFKFSQMNECSPLHLVSFEKMSLPGKKLMFVNNPNHNFNCGVYYPGFENDAEIDNDTFYWNRYINIIKFLNQSV